MRKSKFSETQIVEIGERKNYSEEQVAYALRLAESGTPVADVCRSGVRGSSAHFRRARAELAAQPYRSWFHSRRPGNGTADASHMGGGDRV